MAEEETVTPEIKSLIKKSEETFATMRKEQKDFNDQLEAKGVVTAEQIGKIEGVTNALTKQIALTQKAIARQTEQKSTDTDEQKSLDILNRNLRAVNKKEVSVDQARDVNRVTTKMLQMRQGMNLDLTAAEQKSINGVVDPAGGYFMMPMIDTALTKKAFDARGFINAANNIVTARREFIKLSDLSNYSDSRYRSELDENQAATDDDRFREIRIAVGIQYYPEIFKREFLEDDELNIEADVLEGMRLGMIRKDAQGAIDGIGTNNDPMKGVLSYAEGAAFGQIERITSTDAAGINLDDILKLLPDSLKEDYERAYYMSRQMYTNIITLKDGGGQYLFDRHWDLFDGAKLQFFGNPVVFDAGMTTSLATGAQPIIYGDAREGYKVVKRLGFSLHKDDSSASRVKVTGRSRVGGGVTNFEALKVLKIK